MSDFTKIRVLTQPPRIAIGVGCVQQCAADLASRGARRVFVVSSPRAVQAGATLWEALHGSGAELAFFTAVRGETDVAQLDAALREARSFRPDAVIGLGGGSALDLAKLVAVLHNGSQALGEVFGNGLLRGRRTVLVCAPTTSGTGSEVSPNAIIVDEQSRKQAVISPHLVPDAAYVDAGLMVNVPPDVTAATGMDALTHCIEAYANRNAHPAVDLYALEGIRLIAHNLEMAVHRGQNLAARAAVAHGSLLGGLCLGPVNTAAVHALAYALSAEFKTPHGLANALLLTAVLRFNLPAAPARYAAIAAALGISGAGDDLATAVCGVEHLEELGDACGLPRGLAQIGVSESAVPRLAAEAIKVQRLLKNNVREVSQSDAEAIFRAAL